MFFRISIVESDHSFSELLHHKLNTSLFSHPIPYRITVYNSIRSFTEDLGYESHLIFLSVTISDGDGIALAKQIYNKNSQAIVVFTADDDERIKAAFGLNVLNFFTKQEMLMNVDETVKTVISLSGQKNPRRLVFETDTGMVSFFEGDIRCIVYHDRNPYVCVGDKEFRLVNNSIKKIEKMLSATMFYRINKGCIINLSKIIRINSREVELMDDATIYSISRGKYRDLRDHYAEFIRLQKTLFSWIII